MEWVSIWGNPHDYNGNPWQFWHRLRGANGNMGRATGGLRWRCDLRLLSGNPPGLRGPPNPPGFPTGHYLHPWVAGFLNRSGVYPPGTIRNPRGLPGFLNPRGFTESSRGSSPRDPRNGIPIPILGTLKGVPEFLAGRLDDFGNAGRSRCNDPEFGCIRRMDAERRMEMRIRRCRNRAIIMEIRGNSGTAFGVQMEI
jgi:hypothetical protein